MLKLLRDLKQAIVGPFRRLARFSREGQNDNRDIVDAAPDDQRLGNAFRQIADVGADLLINPQHRGVLVGADEEARGDDGPIVLSLRIDVLDAVDALDDVLERTGHEFDRLTRFVSVGADQDVDHRHTNLRLFLAGQGKHR